MESRKTNIAVEDRFKVVPFEEFCDIAHVGYSRGYEFLNSGDIKSVLVGRRRLVLIQSWYDYLERLLEEQCTFTPGRHPASRQSPPSEPADPPPAQGSPPPRRRGRPRKYPRLADTADPAPAAANQRWADARRRAAVAARGVGRHAAGGACGMSGGGSKPYRLARESEKSKGKRLARQL